MTTGRTRVEVLAIGSELLTPYHLDTNSLFITESLQSLGMRVAFKTVVGDEKSDLGACIRTAMQRSDVIFTMGGLGPTQDDITREAFAAALDLKLVFQAGLWEKVQARFKKRGIRISKVNRKQAYVLEGAEPLENPHGTAPGLWLEHRGKVIVLLPGPPRELKPMVSAKILPRLQARREGYQVRRELKITGLTESQTEDLISDLYPRKGSDLGMTILSSPGQIELHFTAFSPRSEQTALGLLKGAADAVIERLGENIFSTNGESLESVLGNLLLKHNGTLAVAESCTGGLLGHRITNVPGSSAYFLEGVQVYSNDAKMRLLGIDPILLEKHGAVSAEVASQMAEKIRADSGASYGLAVTGIAGPGGGTVLKPVGLVFIALAGDTNTEVSKNQFWGDRVTIKERASQKALDMLRRRLLKNFESTRA